MRKAIAAAIVLVCLASAAKAEEPFFITGPAEAHESPESLARR
ncbi:MAG: hypothetical protein O7G83_17425 [Proteobacteria bacterium]|jgi:hypothetical protein|nr:hypothetical protein [Pseudomonadota bacterium]